MFTPIVVKFFDADPKDRVLVFKNRQDSEFLGAIRVLESETDEQDKHGKMGYGKVELFGECEGQGAYVGLILARCWFEVMYIDVKLITLK